MSYSIETTQQQLPKIYLGVTLVIVLTICLLPYRWLFTNTQSLLLLPLWMVLAHLLCGLSYCITGSLRNGIGILKSSFLVYRSLASATHLQAAFLTAALEEVLFRYALLYGLLHLIQNKITALLVVSLIFALAHIRRWNWKNLFSGVDLFVFALVLGGITFLTATLYPAIILHGMRNYILRCLLISKEEYAALKQKESVIA